MQGSIQIITYQADDYRMCAWSLLTSVNLSTFKKS